MSRTLESKGDLSRGTCGWRVQWSRMYAAGQGMRPAVVLRGSKGAYMAEVSVCYLLHFDRITTAGGAFQ